jgi:geranylgeranyl pyrophosphate synthase
MVGLEEQVHQIVQRYGEEGYGLARSAVLGDGSLFGPVKTALEFFICECWSNRQHPALVSLACQSVGGTSDACDHVGAALVLLTGAADIHDDIMDRSKTKGPLQTAYGRFGADTTLMAGDILLLKAQTFLAQACDPFSAKFRQVIRGSIDDAFTEVGCAVATERLLKADFHVDPAKYWSIIHAKGAISEAFAKVGAHNGGATEAQVALLGHFGRTFGVLMAAKNEFIDLHVQSELSHRARYETVPLPILYALHDPTVRPKILPLLEGKITKTTTENIARLVFNTKLVQDLIVDLKAKANAEKNQLNNLKNSAELGLLLELSVAGY